PRNDDDPVRRNPGLVALVVLRHQLHALIAPLERLLHDGADDAALLDAAEGDRVLIEADDLDLPELARFLQHFVNARRIVGIETDEAAHVRHRGENVLDIALGAGLINFIAANVDEFDLRTLDGLAGVVGAEQANEAHALAAIGQRLEHQLASILAESGVGRTNIGDPLG